MRELLVWLAIGAVCAVGLVVAGLFAGLGRIVEASDERIHDREMTAWRGDVEDVMYQRGDPRGTYGTWDGVNP